MPRALALSLALLAAQPAVAACTAPDVRDRLTDAELAEVAEEVRATPNGEGLFWTATRGPDRLSIVGTMHLYDPRFDQMLRRLEPLLRDADLLLLEAGPEQEARMASALSKDRSLLLLPEDERGLSERMDPETYAALGEALAARGVPPEAADRMQPWYLALTLAIPACAMADLVAGKKGIDARLAERATALGLPIEAIEPWNTLFDLMSSDPIDEQIPALESALMPQDLSTEMHATLLDSYFAGDVAEILALNRVVSRRAPGMTPAEIDAEFARMEADLISGRNRDWVISITQEMDKGDVAVLAVGAAHLPGNTGLLALLERDGWKVTPGL